jgi:hypothetical protein
MLQRRPSGGEARAAGAQQPVAAPPLSPRAPAPRRPPTDAREDVCAGDLAGHEAPLVGGRRRRAAADPRGGLHRHHGAALAGAGAGGPGGGCWMLARRRCRPGPCPPAGPGQPRPAAARRRRAPAAPASAPPLAPRGPSPVHLAPGVGVRRAALRLSGRQREDERVARVRAHRRDDAGVKLERRQAALGGRAGEGGGGGVWGLLWARG